MKSARFGGLALVLLVPAVVLFVVRGDASPDVSRASCVDSTVVVNSRGSLRIGTLNWRGHSHYRFHPHPDERPSSVRVPHMVDKINDSGASLIGFQELQRPQAKAFLQATEGQWKIVAGRARGREAPVNSIAYLPRLWRPTQVRYVPIEYSTWVTELPLVRFASRRGLGPIWVLNTHNPADVVGGSNALRDAAVRAEAKALRRVRASEPKAAVFFTGDMNDRARFKRRFAAKVGDRWSAANPTDDEIDWVMGGPGVTFTDVVVDQSTDDDGYRYSDHPFIHATAHLTRSDRPGRVVTRRVTRCGEA